MAKVKRALALFMLALLLVPQAQAAPTIPEYPPEFLALAKKWIAEAESFGENDTTKPWYPEAAKFLALSKDMIADGRVRATMYELETYYELVLTGRVIDDAQALASDAERKTFALQRVGVWREESIAAWADYREKLVQISGDVHSLQAMEIVLYSADNALSGRLTIEDHQLLARDFPKQPTFSRDYLLALVRADHTSLLNIQWASEMLDVAGIREGVPPRLEEANWSVQVNTTLADPGYTNVPAHLETIEKIAVDVRANGEGVMAMALYLAGQRVSRATNIVVIFGDAQSRGMDVVTDASRGMLKQLNNTTSDAAKSYGLLGLFPADAVDRGVFTQSFVATGQADLSTIISAWAGLDYQGYATAVLAAASPIVPQDDEPAKAATPFPWVYSLAALCIVAAMLRRR